MSPKWNDGHIQCGCGCDELITPKWNSETKQFTRFKQYHHLRLRRLLSDEDEAEVARLYTEEMLSPTELSKQFNACFATIKGALDRQDVEYLDASTSMTRRRIDLTFFDQIDSQAKAYWLGFIAADGNITHRKDGYSLRIALKADDRDHLKKFMRDIGSVLPVRDYTQNGRCYARISVSGRLLIESLEALGIVPKKALVLRYPLQIPCELDSHFIRGYFDGDGSICQLKNKQIQFSIVSTREFLTVCLDKIATSAHVEPITIRQATRSSTSCHFIYTGKRRVCRIMNWLYKDATVFLTRKRQRYLELIQGEIQPWLF